jgi:hypothetical protein
MTAGNLMRDDMHRLGFDQRKTAAYTMKLQADIVAQMLGDAAAAGPRAGRRRDAIRGLLNPGRGALSQQILDFVHPPQGLAAAPPWHQAAIAAWTRAGRFVDNLLA